MTEDNYTKAVSALLGAEVMAQDVFDAHDGLRAMTHLCFSLSQRSGWWDGLDPQDPYVFGTKMSLIHSEASEMLEGGRKGLPDTHLPHRSAEEVEAADLVIRIFDLAGARKLDVAGAVIEKLAYNQQRADHKIDVRAEAGGKKF